MKDIESAKAALATQFGVLEVLTAEREGYQAILLSPLKNGPWSTQDDLQMGKVFTALGIRQGLVPLTTPAFSGRMATANEPFITHALDSERLLVRFTSPCEGGWLGAAGEALTLGLGGCMLVVARSVGQDGTRYLAACHAGFRSVVDIDALAGNPPRRYESVVESIADEFLQRYQISHEAIDIECFFGLAPGALVYHYGEGDRETRKEYLNHLAKYGEAAGWEIENERGRAIVVDPGAIFLAQARRAGFKSAVRSCDITDNGPFGNTRHKSIARNRPNFSAIVRTR